MSKVQSMENIMGFSAHFYENDNIKSHDDLAAWFASVSESKEYSIGKVRLVHCVDGSRRNAKHIDITLEAAKTDLAGEISRFNADEVDIVFMYEQLPIIAVVHMETWLISIGGSDAVMPKADPLAALLGLDD